MPLHGDRNVAAPSWTDQLGVATLLSPQPKTRNKTMKLTKEQITERREELCKVLTPQGKAASPVGAFSLPRRDFRVSL